MKIAALLKREIKQAESQGKVAKGSGIDQANLSRFLNSGSDIRLSSVQALLDYFGYVLVKKRGRK